MADRTKIGILFAYSENWIAGTYYITNLIHALNLLHDSCKPEIIILSNGLQDGIIKEIGYPYLRFLPIEIKYNYAERIINKLSRIIIKINSINKNYTDKDFDIVFPIREFQYLSEIKNKLHWIPDFQERYFPDLFSESNLKRKSDYYNTISNSGDSIIFSSENAQKDFFKFYPKNNCKTYVLHFASNHPEYSMLDINLLKQKYNISGDYFISPNQFWEHKNHLVVLKAAKLLKEMNYKFTVVFTGKEYDSRNPDYFVRLKRFVSENNLQEQVRFLGFIDRREQLKLMNYSLAVIQPSLFEGWSTVVEDAKEMNQYVLLSDIKVHREQLNYNVSFFNPINENELLKKMIEVINEKIIRIKKDYQLNVLKFGNDFMKIINEIVKK